MFKDKKMEGVLQDLIGCRVHLSYSTSTGESYDCNGKLVDVTSDFILIRDTPLETPCWINRRSTTLNTIRLLSRRRRKKKTERR